MPPFPRGAHAFCLVACFHLLQIRAGIAKSNDFVVGGYLPEYRSYINLNNTIPYLTDVILFSMTPDNDGTFGSCCLDSHHFEQARQARAYQQTHFPEKQRLKIWVSVGGAGRSNSFAAIVLDPSKRKAFLNSLRSFWFVYLIFLLRFVSQTTSICANGISHDNYFFLMKIYSTITSQKEEIDGVDFDWEAPRGEEEMRGYIVLMWDAAKMLKENGNIMLSVALHPGQVSISDFYASVDRVNLMTYDMITETGMHHATIKNTKAAVKILIDSGCPKQKIVVGIPAYARHGKNPGDVKTYSEVIDGLMRSNLSSPDEDVISRKSWKGYLFDSPSLVKKKVDHAIQTGLAGVFFWELGQDKQHADWGPGGILLQAAGQQVAHSVNGDEEEEL